MQWWWAGWGGGGGVGGGHEITDGRERLHRDYHKDTL